MSAWAPASTVSAKATPALATVKVTTIHTTWRSLAMPPPRAAWRKLSNLSRVAGAVRPLNNPHHVRHNAVEFEVLRRIDRCHAGFFHCRRVFRWDDASHHQRHGHAGFLHARHHVSDQRHVAARQHRQPDDVRLLLARGIDDLFRRQTNALIDHLHAGVARTNRDLLGAVTMAVEAGLADQEGQPAAELTRDAGMQVV